MSEEGAAALASGAEPSVLVRGLPVGLEQEVAGQVRQQQHDEGLGPGHLS